MGTEAKLQTKIINKLEADGWIVVKTIQLSKNGFPDLFCFKNGRAIFIEVKAPNGKLSELQKYRIEQLQKENFTALVINEISQLQL